MFVYAKAIIGERRAGRAEPRPFMDTQDLSVEDSDFSELSKDIEILM